MLFTRDFEIQKWFCLKYFIFLLYSSCFTQWMLTVFIVCHKPFLLSQEVHSVAGMEDVCCSVSWKKSLKICLALCTFVIKGEYCKNATEWLQKNSWTNSAEMPISVLPVLSVHLKNSQQRDSFPSEQCFALYWWSVCEYTVKYLQNSSLSRK